MLDFIVFPEKGLYGVFRNLIDKTIFYHLKNNVNLSEIELSILSTMCRGLAILILTFIYDKIKTINNILEIVKYCIVIYFIYFLMYKRKNIIINKKKK